MFPHLKLLCLLFMGPTLGFDTKQINSFLIKFGAFYNKSKILAILVIVKYEKIALFDEFLVLLGPIISSFFACSNEEKNKQKQQRVLALVLSLWKKSTSHFLMMLTLFVATRGAQCSHHLHEPQPPPHVHRLHRRPGVNSTKTFCP
jgi:hypothetical protein